MRKIIVKRLLYRSGRTGEVLIGNTTYDNHLTDDNILGSVHEVGKTAWIGNQLWLVRDNDMIYHITVGQFTRYEKTWFDSLLDWIRRV